MTFIKLEKVRAITNAIIKTSEGFDLLLSELQDQGYNGTDTMSGQRADVQKTI